jgi:hypothetical protein
MGFEALQAVVMPSSNMPRRHAANTARLRARVATMEKRVRPSTPRNM